MEWDQHNFGSARRLWRTAANSALRQARKAAAASSAVVFHCWASAENERDNVRNARIVISEALRKCPNDALVGGCEGLCGVWGPGGVEVMAGNRYQCLVCKVVGTCSDRRQRHEFYQYTIVMHLQA